MINLDGIYANMGADLLGGFSMVLLTVVGVILVVWDAFRNDAPAIPWVAAGTLALCMIWEAFGLALEPGAAFFGMIRTGGFAAFINLVILGATLFSVVLSVPYLRGIGRSMGEVYAIILFATVGMILLATSLNLVGIFVGLETMSVALYILTGLVREDEGAIESALKYFLLGAFSTGFFLYGIALLYGSTGTMYLPLMSAGLAASGNYLLFWAGVALLMIGFFFKVSAAPFHMWTPDVYQGAPTTLTGYMSTASKAAAFASLILVLVYALPPEAVVLDLETPLAETVAVFDLPSGDWGAVLAFIAALTMVLGNVLALAQRNVKRMLAYSSIAHAGYVLTGLAAGTASGYSGALFYLLVYALMNIGAFGVLALLEWDGKEGREQTLDSLAGTGTRYPLLGAAMGVFMFSLTGFPPLGGFMGKVAVFGPAIDAGLTWLAVVGVLASAASAGYYLRILWVMFMKAPEDYAEARPVAERTFAIPAASAAVLAACVVLLLVLGVLPSVGLGLTDGFFGAGSAVASMP